MTSLSGALPRIYIGSSVEGIDVAKAIQQNLDRETESTVWTQDIFQVSQIPVDSLLEGMASQDFAIFVFTPDDKTKVRGVESPTVRDNVILEVGIALGQLGRNRTLLLFPREGSGFRIPSDLFGITPATYAASRSDQNLLAAVGAACEQFRVVVKRLGRRTSDAASGVTQHSEELRSALPTDADVVAVIKMAALDQIVEKKRGHGTVDLQAIEKKYGFPLGTCSPYARRAMYEAGLEVSGEPGIQFVSFYQPVRYG